MVGLDLVRPLDDDWRETLDAVAAQRGWPSSRQVERLASAVSALSRAYNDPTRARSSLRDSGPARLGFCFARDVPKGAAAVRELIATGLLRPRSTLRVLDVGAGLGAMTWGLFRALQASGWRGALDATWIDEDAEALDVGVQIARRRADGPRVHRVVGGADDLGSRGRFDVVLLGHVLSEIGVHLDERRRVDGHAAIVRRLLDRHVERNGSVVIVEPALRDRTRRLHALRDALLLTGASVVAPCLHAAACPALAEDEEWCHEDLAVDLPAWLWPVARAAGLRREGLTFSYLVVRAEGAGLRDVLAAGSRRPMLRVVSARFETKGKTEAFLCGEFRQGADPSPTYARARVTRLDRDASSANDAWSEVARGELLEIDPPLQLPRDRERPRIGRCSAVRRLTTQVSSTAPTASEPLPQTPGEGPGARSAHAESH